MEIPSRNLALELVRVTETAAIAAAKWIGRGAKNDADGAAVEAMRKMISTVQMRGTVVIGEGEKDDAPMLYNGELVGDGTGPECDVAVDPIDGTTLTAKGANNAISVIALASRGSMLNLSDSFYMLKLAVGPEATGVIDINESITENLKRIANAKRKNVDELTVVMIDRPRHEKFAEEIRVAGARIKFIQDGDVAGSIMAARPGTGVDLLYGIGGTPEGVISACAMQCLGGEIQGKLAPQSEGEKTQAIKAGLNLNQVYTSRDLVKSDYIFLAATGITPGELLEGIRYGEHRIHSQSIVMRSLTNTVRIISTEHLRSKS
jgi:fructose-1,6-bisphosphatase II